MGFMSGEERALAAALSRLGYANPFLPERIEADVTALMIGDVLTVAQLRAPEGVRILTPPGKAVATVVPPMAEEAPVAAAPAAAAVTEPEVLTERKPKEEEAAPEEGKKAKRPEKTEKEK